MANLNAPHGFNPVGTVSGASWSQQGRMYAIASDASNTYAIGDVVKVAAGADANGVPKCVKLSNGGAAGDVPLGVIVGFVNPNAGGTSLVGSPLTLEQIYLTLSAGTQYVMVVDDPFIIMEAQFDSTVIVAADLHKNCAYTVTQNQTTLSQSSPLSSIVLTTPNTGVTYPLQIMGVVQRPETQGVLGAYTKMLVKWNYHQFGMAPVASGGAGA